MLFTAAFAILLSKYTGSEDVIIGTPVSGRREPELWNVLGPFLNTLPCVWRLKRIYPSRIFLTGQNVGFGHAGQPGRISRGDPVSDQCERSVGQTALYNVMLSYRPMEEEAFFLDGEAISCTPLETG